MTIRTKLLLFIPLLVLLVNSVTFFLFQSGKLVQQSYNQMMDRLLLYNESIQTVERNLGALHTYLLNPDDSNYELFLNSLNKLTELRVMLQDHSDASLHSAKLTSYNHMLDTFIEQEEAAFKAVTAETLLTSLDHYEKAEKTAGFIREDEQQLVDLELSIYQPIYKKIQAENKTMYLLGAAVFIINTLLSILLAVWISRSITVPVSRLVSRVKQISKGDLQHNALTYPAKDELGLLAGAFEQMSGDLLEMIEKVKESLEKDRLVKALELQALQSQINPHFLFNTLNVLSKLSLIEGAEKTSDLIISMSNLLRYNLRNLAHAVTLEDEVEHVKEYFIIQQARFRERIKLEMDIDPSALQQPIPALTLQPIVENAFLHGIERMEKDAVIRLEITQDADGVYISVSDNGNGMSDEVRQALLRLEAETENKQSAGLGTKNVFKRLQLFYGVSGLVSIESKLGEGTKIIIRIPSGKDGEHNHVPTVNRG
ncbi:histidine kinase [Paenibacillus sp. LHD-38]|uniref:sensor histidine kinase n=1 Tax=Paenibacillus sp. LHD-38 TaxID=3072143 RepID=UPI00280ECC1B|nr:histidine kinase [Paenibacillus sp. LHD-38]MDQ8736810.1 histidine kinase [Paenibacillus sp. LHD-38]